MENMAKESVTSILIVPTNHPHDEVLPLLLPHFTRTVATAPGFHSMNWGFCIEEPEKLFIFVNWKTVALRKSYLESPIRAAAADKLIEISNGEITYLSLYLPALPAPPFANNAPMMELFTLDLLPGVGLEHWQQCVRRTADAVAAQAGRNYFGHSGGKLEGGKGNHMLIAGWQGLDEHRELMNSATLEGEGNAIVQARVALDVCFENPEVVHVKIEGGIKA